MFVFFDGGAGDGLGALGLQPWWAAPGLKAAFLRPLAVATHLLDYALWPATPWAMHLHSLLWLGVGVLGAAALYRRLCGAPRAAALAILLFAVQDLHAGPALWIANRNALIALALSTAALLAHDRWRREGAPGAAVLGVLAFAAALLAGEAALCCCAYLAAYAAFLDPAPRARRLASLAPYVPVLAGWAAWYAAGGYGTAGSQAYIDPLSRDFSAALAERLPALLAALWARLPCDAWVALPRAGQVALAGAGAVTTAGIAWLLLPALRASAQARFWAAGSTLALVPVAAGMPMERLLLAAGLGGAALLAEALAARGWPALPLLGPRRFCFRALIALHLGLAPVLLPLKVVAFGAFFGFFSRVADIAPADAALVGQRLVWVNGESVSTGMLPVVRTLRGQPAPVGQWLLCHMLTDVDLSRPDARTLVATAPAGFLATPPEQLLRDVRIPFHVSDRIERDGLVVQVEDLTADARPRVVRFDFPVDLDDPALRWLVWEDGHLVPFRVPRVGETVHVAPAWPPLLP
jgi:hypothetical protein